jgi:hypothetical protein
MARLTRRQDLLYLKQSFVVRRCFKHASKSWVVCVCKLFSHVARAFRLAVSFYTGLNVPEIESGF